MTSPVRFSCDVAVGEPADRVTLMVGTTGAVFVEGPSGLTAALGEQDSRAFAQVILARVGVAEKAEKTARRP